MGLGVLVGVAVIVGDAVDVAVVAVAVGTDAAVLSGQGSASGFCAMRTIHAFEVPAAFS